MISVKVNDECEWYPVCCISIGERNYSTIQVEQEVYDRWIKTFNEFHKTQSEIRDILHRQENQKEQKQHLIDQFNEPKPSRSQKQELIVKYGWKPVNVDDHGFTSTWEKNGTTVKLHEAYGMCKKEFFQEQNMAPDMTPISKHLLKMLIAKRAAETIDALVSEFVADGEVAEFGFKQQLLIDASNPDNWRWHGSNEDGTPDQEFGSDNLSWAFDCEPLDDQLRAYVITNAAGTKILDLYIQGE